MHKKSILIIIIITVLAFANSLTNDFVGDDTVVFVTNSFYNSLKNVPKLFSKEYITDGDNFETYADGEYDRGSGSIGYRPVLSATYFVDKALWGTKPFGYHLHSLLLHVVNSILVYFLIFLVLKNKNVALLSAVLFAVHPTKVEAVCSIGYRADSLSCMFAILSFLCFLMWRRPSKEKGRLFYAGSLLFFFLGLFSKESVVVLPALLVAYDLFFGDPQAKKDWKAFSLRYCGHAVVSVFYLYVYLFVFRNSTLGNIGFLNGTLSNHVITAFLIFLKYVVDFVFPLGVHVLAPVYVPPIGSMWLVKTVISFVALSSMIVLSVKAYRRSRVVSFFMFWFLISLVPVSNIVPIANPMAHRFLYFPSIGLLTVFAIGIERLCAKLSLFKKVSFDFGNVAKFCIIAMCMIQTFSLNGFWRDDPTMVLEFVRRYPKNPNTYLHLGICAFQYGNMHETINALEHSLKLGANDPRAYYLLALSYSRINPGKSVEYYKKVIRFYPKFYFAYIGLARQVLLYEKDTAQAYQYLEEAFKFNPTYSGYGYLIQIYLMEGKINKAKGVLKEAEAVLANEDQIRSLRNFLKLRKTLTLPIDIGV